LVPTNSPFDAAFRKFESDAYSLLHESLFDVGRDLPSFKIQIQAQSLATDIGYFAMVMRDLHSAAIREISDEMDYNIAEYKTHLEQRLKESSILDEQFFQGAPSRKGQISVALAKFGASYKAFLFLVRGYQDAIYKIGLCICGQKVGGKSGMTSAIDVATLRFFDANPVAQMIRIAVPDYPGWFASIRRQRDYIKYGAGVSYSTSKNFVTGETTAAIKLSTSAGHQSSLSLDDVSQALLSSAEVTLAIVAAGIASGKLSARMTRRVRIP
jgi:hypothetical protein